MRHQLKCISQTQDIAGTHHTAETSMIEALITEFDNEQDARIVQTKSCNTHNLVRACIAANEVKQIVARRFLLDPRGTRNIFCYKLTCHSYNGASVYESRHPDRGTHL